MSSSIFTKAADARKRSFGPVVVRHSKKSVAREKNAPMLLEYWFVFVATALAAMFFFAQMEFLTAITSRVADSVNAGVADTLREMQQILSGELIDTLRRFMPPLPTLPKLPF